MFLSRFVNCRWWKKNVDCLPGCRNTACSRKKKTVFWPINAKWTSGASWKHPTHWLPRRCGNNLRVSSRSNSRQKSLTSVLATSISTPTTVHQPVPSLTPRLLSFLLQVQSRRMTTCCRGFPPQHQRQPQQYRDRSLRISKKCCSPVTFPARVRPRRVTPITH